MKFEEWFKHDAIGYNEPQDYYLAKTAWQAALRRASELCMEECRQCNQSATDTTRSANGYPTVAAADLTREARVWKKAAETIDRDAERGRDG